jgi:hypothetical protein
MSNNFKRISNTNLGSKVMSEGLVPRGVLTPGFRVIQGFASPTDIGDYQLLDRNGNPLQLGSNDRIVYGAVSIQDFTSAGAPEMEVGLSATNEGTIAASLSAATASADGGYAIDTFAMPLVGVNNYVVITTTVAAFDTGNVTVTLMIA